MILIIKELENKSYTVSCYLHKSFYLRTTKSTALQVRTLRGRKVKAVALVTQSLDLDAGGLPSVPTSLSPLDWAGEHWSWMKTDVWVGKFDNFSRAGPSLIHPPLPHWAECPRPQRHGMFDRQTKEVIDRLWYSQPLLDILTSAEGQNTTFRQKDMEHGFFIWDLENSILLPCDLRPTFSWPHPQIYKIWERPFINFLGEHLEISSCVQTPNNDTNVCQGRAVLPTLPHMCTLVTKWLIRTIVAKPAHRPYDFRKF